jgi:predicted nucleic acid binding AN1-type Zn finger protein
MPNPVNRRVGEQWQTCDRCGFLYPMSKLVKQKGILICTYNKCFDNLDIDRRDLQIMQILGEGVQQEGADLRLVDRGFFEGFDETNR